MSEDAVGRPLHRGSYVMFYCQGRKVYGYIKKLSETWAWVEHVPAKQRPSEPPTHVVRVRQWKTYATRDGEQQSMSEDMYAVLKGHQLSYYKPTPGKKEGIDGAKYKAWEILCSCGWQVKREKVFKKFAKNGEPILKDEDLAIFRARGPQHLYQVVIDSRQGRLV